MAITVNPGLAKDRARYTPYELTTAPVLICPEPGDQKESQHYVHVQYLNQGGANVVFQIHKWPPRDVFAPRPAAFAELIYPSDPTSQLKTRDRAPFLEQVLRLNKGLHKTLRCDEVVRGFYEDVRPLFCPGEILVHEADTPPQSARVVPRSLPNHDLTSFLMEHELIALFPSVMRDLTAKCSVISKEDGAETLTAKRWGILLPDMSSKPGSSMTLEIKPKWLLQSPTAPKGAVRCRTCALQSTKAKDLATYFCPLRVLAGDQQALYTWLLTKVNQELIDSASIHQSVLSNYTSTIAMCIAKYLTQGEGAGILEHLKLLQSALDPYGVLKRHEMELTATFDRNLRLAMTLRDCSVFLNVSYTADPEHPARLTTKIECKLGDLDFKSIDKLNDWAEKENALLESGAYTKATDYDLGCLLSLRNGQK